MRKCLLTMVVVIPVCALRAQAGCPTSFHCDFNNGIPDNVRLVDNDGNDPSADVSAFGFAKGTSWIDVRTDDTHLRSAASTSWYKTPAQSDDWMILPKVRIVSSDVTLAWEARAHDSVLSDGYEIYISESGDEVEDFKRQKPFFSCTAEKGDWTGHVLSLSDYAGKEINIAFVNNSRDKALLYIDNIAIEEQRFLSATRFVPALLTVGENLSIAGTVANNTDADMRGVSVKFSIEGREYVKDDRNMVIPAHGSVNVALDTDFVSGEMQSYPYVLNVSAGEYSLTDYGSLLSVRQNVLMEEGTGTWCMWCPKGAVAIERLKTKYPDTFIPVAVHNGDPMVVDGYSVYTTSGYPVCVANRMDRLRGNPDDMEKFYLDAAGKTPVVGLVSSGTFDTTTKQVALNTELAFAKEYQDARFALQYIVVENNVHCEKPGYNQRNTFSGGDQPMGGFENLPDPVPASQMWYQEVARMLVGGESGIEGSIPAYIEAGEPIPHNYDFVLDDNVMNPCEVRVIAAVVDTKTGEVVNSAYAPVDGLSGIHDIDVRDAIRIERYGTMLRVVTDSAVEELQLISVDGYEVGENAGTDCINVAGLPHGIYIVRVKTDGKYRYVKLTL